MPSTSAEIVRECLQLEPFRDIWNELRSHSFRSAVSYEEYRNVFYRENNDAQMRLVVIREHGHVVTLAPFLLLEKRKSYFIGPRHLFSLPVRMLRLMGNCFVGKTDSEQVRHVFDALAKCNDFDLIPFYELEAEGLFHSSIRSGLANSSCWKCVNSVHKLALHWFLDLPSTFEEYMSSLSSKVRRNLRRELRNFENELDGRVRVVTAAEDVDWFLTVGEQISRLTYQWNLGQRLCYDESTRREYLLNAESGILRCHVLLAGEQPCAFARGFIKGNLYYYDTPGFDPGYSKASPGTVLLLRVIEDLIANTECRVLDFGIGGGNSGYKKILGNRCYEAVSLEVGRRWDPYARLLFGIQGAVNFTKRFGESVLGKDYLKRIAKRILRKYGSR